MKKLLFSWRTNKNLVDLWLLISRVALATFMLTHGYPKFLKLLAGGPYSFADPFGIGVAASLVLAVLSEFIAPLFILFGLFSRLASVPVIFTMFTAAFIFHAADPFARRELALLYLVGFLAILILGPGKYSVDRMMKK